MPYTQQNGVRIHFEVVGEGFPVLLHTGAAGDRNMWRHGGYLDGLAGFRCILLDRRGSGLSDKPREPGEHRMDQYVADVTAVLDAAQVERAVFWGHADGACVGFAFAATHPHRVAGLVAHGSVGPAGWLKARAAGADIFRAAGMASLSELVEQAESIHLPAWLWENFAETDPSMYALALAGWHDWDGPWGALPRVTAPVLLLGGELEDPENLNREAAEILPRAEAIALKGVGQVGSFLESREVLSHAAPWLARLAAAT